MITIKEAKEISLKIELTDVEQLAVIERYIYDKKNVSVGTLARPNRMMYIQMMLIAFDVAAEYYAMI